MQNAPVTIRLLGNVAILPNRSVQIGTPRRRTVLACLALDAGRPVALQTLLRRVWGDLPPAAAHTSLSAHLTGIRRALGYAAPNDAAPVRLTRRPGGYLLDVDPDRVDLHRFHRLLRAATRRDRPEAERVAHLRTALDLWRGQPLGGVPGDWAARLRDQLVQQRLDVAALWADGTVRLGRPAEAVDSVHQLVADHPLAERLVAALMRALARSGRSAQALDLFATTRTRLAEELGTEPGPELRRIHREIRHGEIEDPAPVGPRPALAAAVRPPRQAPTQLPCIAPTFSRRVIALDEPRPTAS